MALSNLCFLINVLFLVNVCCTYKILIFAPGLSNSHLMFIARFANLLVENKQHEVVILVEEYKSDTKRYTLKENVKEITFTAVKDKNTVGRFLSLDAFKDQGMLGKHEFRDCFHVKNLIVFLF